MPRRRLRPRPPPLRRGAGASSRGVPRSEPGCCVCSRRCSATARSRTTDTTLRCSSCPATRQRRRSCTSTRRRGGACRGRWRGSTGRGVRRGWERRSGARSGAWRLRSGAGRRCWRGSCWRSCRCWWRRVPSRRLCASSTDAAASAAAASPSTTSARQPAPLRPSSRRCFARSLASPTVRRTRAWGATRCPRCWRGGGASSTPCGRCRGRRCAGTRRRTWRWPSCASRRAACSRAGARGGVPPTCSRWRRWTTWCGRAGWRRRRRRSGCGRCTGRAGRRTWRPGGSMRGQRGRRCSTLARAEALWFLCCIPPPPFPSIVLISF
eukprot:Rhum_TRINITY_DN3478_c0_g1::Rhum_TRINITY_DN3478_c0_g1_i1::g.10910::m.10910